MQAAMDELRRFERSRSFEDIVGHDVWREDIIANLKRSIAADEYPPLALIGPAGVGKVALAKLYAQAVVCLRELRERPSFAQCGICDECAAIEKNGLALVCVDVRVEPDAGQSELDAERVQADYLHTLIEQEWGLNTARVRVVVVINAQELTSANADIALKTLEAEIGSSLYIFISTSEAGFAPALRSRCDVIRVGPIPREDLLAKLTAVCEAGSIGYDVSALRIIALAAAGSLDTALGLLSKATNGGGLISSASLLSLPELSWGRRLLDCWKLILSGRYDEAASLFDGAELSNSARLRAMQAFLAECAIRGRPSTVTGALSISPALDCASEDDWTAFLALWNDWCQQREVPLEEELSRHQLFWATVRLDTPSKVAFAKGLTLLTTNSTS